MDVFSVKMCVEYARQWTMSGERVRASPLTYSCMTRHINRGGSPRNEYSWSAGKRASVPESEREICEEAGWTLLVRRLRIFTAGTWGGGLGLIELEMDTHTHTLARTRTQAHAHACTNTHTHTRARKHTHTHTGKGPFVLEMNTYRYHGHSMSDPGLTYRSREEVSGVRKERDPIDKLKRIAKELGYATDASIKEIEKEVRAVVDEAVAFAKADGEPPLTELYTDVEVPNPEYIRGTDGIYGHGQCEWARQ